MPAPESADANAAHPGLFASLRNLWGVFVAILYTRLDLVTTELEESGTHAVQLVVVSLAGLFCAGMAIFFLLCFLVILSGPYLLLTLGIICVLCLLGGVVLFFVARQMIRNRPKFLGQTLAELRRDVEGLRPVTKPGDAS